MLGDVVATAFAGVVGGTVAAWIVSPGWPMLAGMIGGGVLGMSAMAPALIVFSPLLGAHEVLVPSSLAGAAAGMVVGMRAAQGHAALGEGAVMGVIVGLVTFAGVYVLNAFLTRGTRRWQT